ncbi:prepilin-type N-terminal cleavage/methylation domain-containing protein [Candidatus Azambacteria bacterium]|nr:prepilin-type N-terminal cleavage/methylation domain-containing protein [Candidatus Azambacteria bacterium]
MTNQNRKQGFTLVELIIVITILVILGIVVIVLIDPAEILAQSRDAQRISDLAALKGATQLVLASGVPSNAGTVCYATNPPETLSNPVANIYKSTYTTNDATQYVATATTSRALADVNGWVKINFTTPSTGTAISSLPVDPTNTWDTVATAGLYYRWGCNYNASKYQYEYDAALESAKYKPGCTAAGCDDKGLLDGGNSNTASGTGKNNRYEVGNNLKVLDATAL